MQDRESEQYKSKTQSIVDSMTEMYLKFKAKVDYDKQVQKAINLLDKWKKR